MLEHQWWTKHNGSTFVLPYKRSDSFVAKVSNKLRKGCKSKTSFTSNCVYTKQTNMNEYTIPEIIPLDYNFGYLIGAYCAEGCMTKYQLSIANNDLEYFSPILELCKEWISKAGFIDIEDTIPDCRDSVVYFRKERSNVKEKDFATN